MRTIRTTSLICQEDDSFFSVGRGVAAVGVTKAMGAGRTSDRMRSATCRLFREIVINLKTPYSIKINTKNCSLSTVLTATDQKPQKNH